MFDSFKKMLAMLTPKERRRFILLSIAIVAMALTEVAGIGSISPFLAVATDPEVVTRQPYLRFLYQRLGFDSPERFIAFLGLVVIAFVILRNVVAALVKYMEIRFGQMRNHSLAMRLLAKYLAHPYVFFLDRNSSQLSQHVLAEVGQVVSGYLIPAVEFMAKLVVAVAIIIFLVVMNPLVAVLAAAVIGGLYALIFIAVRRTLGRLGRRRMEANRLRYKIAGEAFGGIKDVKLLGKEGMFLNEFKRPSRKMAESMATKGAIGALPRHAMDMLAFTAVISLISVLSLRGRFEQAIPLVGVYALAGYRLMPTFEQMFRYLAKMRGAQPVLEKLYEELHDDPAADMRLPREAADPLPFERSIELEAVRFRYPNTDEDVICEQSLTIEANTTVGFVGPTGCGKTTMVDIILGLLTPTGGRLLVDGTPIEPHNVRNWQANLGYVPQHIYLSDDTIARNIAFGVAAEQVDHDRVAAAARTANLADFIETELPLGYNTIVGERGVRLSGGQRQRIGIARALYIDPAVLVMDEATSALDGITEQAIMEAIEALAGRKTIIIIAHRLTTLQDADCIYLLDKGHITARGTYTELLQSNQRFQRMARLNT